MHTRDTTLDAMLNVFLEEAIRQTRGPITAGMRADLVVLNGDPTVDIHNTTKIAFVVKNGTVYRHNQ